MAGHFENTNVKFINPYNFVRVDWKKEPVKKDVTRDEENKISGYFECELTTRTPLAIPDPESKKTDANEHSTYSFFRDPVDNVPMIPGSSLRGCIRTVYETASDSCLVTADKNLIFSRRASAYEAGSPCLLIFENRKWVLYSAERYIFIVKDRGYREFTKFNSKNPYSITRIELESKYSFGQKVSFNSIEDGEYKKGKNIVGTLIKEFSSSKNLENEGYLYIGEKMSGKKHFESIFKKETVRQDISLDSNDIEEELKILLDEYNAKEKIPKYYKGVDKLLMNKKEGTVIPVWCNSIEGKTYITLASIGRMVFKNKMGNFIDKKIPCEKRESLCKACALFGMSKEDSISGHVRVTDAKMSCGEYKGKYVTLKELGSPRTSYIPFYAINKNNTSEIKIYDEEGVTLRGRKYYWHNTKERVYEVNSKLADKDKKTNRNATMELVEKGKTYKFKVYFDDISKQQYEELKWTLTLGENKADSNLCYKIGHGKPIGLGSVKITITGAYKRKLKPSYEIEVDSIEEIKNPFNPENNKLLFDELLTIMDIKSTEGKNVSYPYIENNSKPFQWFSANWDKKTVDQKLLNIIEAKDNPISIKKYVEDLPKSDYKNTNGQKGDKKNT